MRGRNICRPDWLSIAAPGLTSMAASCRSIDSALHRLPAIAVGRTAALERRPLLQFLMSAAGQAFHFRLARRDGRQLDADSIGIEELDRLDDVVVSDPQHFDSGCFKARLDRLQVVDRGYAQCEVVDPRGRVGRSLGLDIVTQVEEGNVRAVAHLEKDVDVGAIFARAWHALSLDHMDQRQAEQIFVEMPGFLAVATAPGEVVKAENRDRGWGCKLRHGGDENACRGMDWTTGILKRQTVFFHGLIG